MATEQANPLWEDDLIQFARLICEIEAVEADLDWGGLSASMDLKIDDINELFDRAHAVWERAKDRI